MLKLGLIHLAFSQIEVFNLVTRLQNYTRASQELHLSQRVYQVGRNIATCSARPECAEARVLLAAPSLACADIKLKNFK